MRRFLAAALTGLVAAVGLGFLVLPIIAIFARVPPGTLLDQLGSGVVRDALVVTLKTSAIAQALVVAFGTPLAWVLASRRLRGRDLLVTLVELPIVLPPAVAGIGLLAALGRTGLLETGLPFTQGAVVAAVAFVAGPLYVRQAIAAFEGLDPNLLSASRTLGAGPGKTFFRVALPLAAGGLAAGLGLSVARGLGEFGATIMFAGSLQGVTQTVSLAIYLQFDKQPDGFDLALALGGLLVLVSIAILLAVKLLAHWTLSPSTSGFLSAPSPSR